MSSICVLLLSTVLASPPQAGPPKPAPQQGPPQGSEAEKIARLQRYVDDDEKQLAALKKQLEDPGSEYHRAEAAFKELDDKLLKDKRNEDQLRKEGKIAEADALAQLRKQWQRARDRFELAIQERKTLQEEAAALPAKIARERKALQNSTGTASEPATEQKEDPKKPEGTATTPSKPDAGKHSGSEQAAENPIEKTAKESRKLREAREKEKEKEDAALQLHDKLKSINEYMDGLKRQIEIEQRLLETARKKVALARQTQADLQEEQNQRKQKNAPKDEMDRGESQINDAVRRVDEAGADEREISDRLADLQAQLGRVQTRQVQAMQEVAASDTEAASAKKTVDDLENPLNPRNILRWLSEHGGRMLGIFLGMIALYLLVKTGTRRIIRVMSAARKRHSGRESEDRAETLIAVLRNTLSVFILGGGVLMLLDEVGIPIVPLMGGAAVVGLAVAFGAQNLIKDYFTGFMVLMEDQYAVNDVVKINGIDGQVERITLRMTVLRDLAGIAHFIPHGAIHTVSNMTHGWSRAALEIGVAYKEDTDHVLEVLQDLCAELRRDEHFAPLILEDAEMLGVDQLADSSVILKFIIKTKPLRQWEVKRELLRRIKLRFDQLGIELPSPHRTAIHRHEDSAANVPRLAT
jgi:moderate conductance mechanosensitive channel